MANKDAEQTQRAGLFRGTTLFTRIQRASPRSKGRTPRDYSVRRTASEATFALRSTGRPFSQRTALSAVAQALLLFLTGQLSNTGIIAHFVVSVNALSVLSIF